jgi:hypothetical protein
MNQEHVTYSAFVELKKQYKKINVIDVGAARAAFLVELSKVFNLTDVFSIGIDPMDHGVIDQYDIFYNICVDDIPPQTKEIKKFFVNSDDQTSSLNRLKVENLSSVRDENKFYYPQHIIDKIKNITETIEVDVYNLNDIIKQDISDNIIHFVKIDAEGNDMNIVKSIQSSLYKIKFICIECPNYIPRFENEMIKDDFIKYFELNNFKVFNVVNAEDDPTNGQPSSDIVFVNNQL